MSHTRKDKLAFNDKNDIMKFRSGMWLPIEGKRLEYAEDVYSITKQPSGRALSLLCPTKHVRSRGDTLNLPTVPIVSTAPIG